MYLVTAEEMREIDKKTIEEYGVPEQILMENAGINMLIAIQQEYGSVVGMNFAVFCKGGNNGGDGVVLARHLKNEGANVKVYFSGDEEKATKDTRSNLERAKKYGIPVIPINSVDDLRDKENEIKRADIIVDALIGTGLKSDVEWFTANLIVFLNTLGKPIVSADIPSGVNSDTGEIMSVSINASMTVAFGLPKLGTAINPGIAYTGKLVFADISFPQELLQRPRKHVLMTQDMIKPLFPFRHPNSNKGHFGPVFILGGSPGLSGAVVLSAKAALRSGAGIVTIGVPKSLTEKVKNGSHESIVASLKENEDGCLSLENFDKIMDIASKSKIVLIGPGIGRSNETRELVRKLVESIECPVVLDADGINAVADDKKCLKNLKKDVILTPHIGEMSRLSEVSIQEVIKDKIGILKRFLHEYKVNVLLKDGRSMLMDTGGNIYINNTGNSGMATPGSGDVLAGVVTAFGAHGISLAQAGILANYVHGFAGDMLLEEISEEGIIAGDLIDAIPKAIKKIK